MVSNLLHSILLILAYIGGIALGYPWVSLIFMLGFFTGREIAQAEYRWIERYGFGLRANMKWYSAFEPKVWDTHSFLWNLSLPWIIAICLYIFTSYRI